MGWIEDLKKRLGANQRAGPSGDKGAVTVFPLGPVWRNRSDHQLTTSEAIFAAVLRISTAMASMPLRLYQGYALAKDHPLDRLIRMPNPDMTQYTFVQTQEAFRNTAGNAYGLLVPNANDTAVERIDVLNTSRVRPQRHETTHEMWYIVTLDDGTQVPVHGSRMLVFRHLSANGEVGISPVDVLKGTLDYSQRVKEISIKQLEGVNGGVALNIPGVGFDKDKRDNAVKAFMDAYTSSNGNVIVLEGGITATMLNQSPIDPKVLDVDKISKNRVAVVYSLPPHMLGDFTKASYSTTEQQNREFAQMTLLPIVTQWEQELNKKLLTPKMQAEGFAFRFDMEALLRGDSATMAETNAKAIRNGWRMPNEVRETEFRPPDPYGGYLMASRDILPLKIAVERPELLLSGAAKEKAGDEK